MIDDVHDLGSFVGDIKCFEEACKDFAIIDTGEDGGIKIERIKCIKKGGNDVGVIGKRKLAASDDVDVKLIKFAETAFLSAFTTEVETKLRDFEWEAQVIFMFDNITGERYGVVESESLIGGFDGCIASFDEFVDLFLGVAASFGKKYFGAFDRRGFDFLVTVFQISIGDFTF